MKVWLVFFLVVLVSICNLLSNNMIITFTSSSFNDFEYADLESLNKKSTITSIVMKLCRLMALLNLMANDGGYALELSYYCTVKVSRNYHYDT